MTTTTKTPTERDNAYFSIFVTALEGGIGYWSRCSVYHWTTATNEENPLDHEDKLGFHATIQDLEEEWFEDLLPETKKDAPTLQVRIDRAVIARGVHKFTDLYKDAAWDYARKAAGDLRNGRWDYLDVDSMIADVIVQLGLFGQVIFG